jgi:transposase
MPKKPPAVEPEPVPESAPETDAGAVGRPSKFDQAFCAEAYEHCLLGATDAELAEHFDIALSTLYEWKKEFPEFSESIKKGKRPADAGIANAIYERAHGAEWIEEQAFKLKRVHYIDGKRSAEEEYIEVVPVTRRAPPDTTAGIFWLKNRKGASWRDKQEVAVTSVDMSRLTNEQVARIAAGEDVAVVLSTTALAE